MSFKNQAPEEINYRVLYGKLFSAFVHLFGPDYVSEIEDAIQNSFLKSLKYWNHNTIPNNKENWLFIVARNDLLTQVKKRKESYNNSLKNIEEITLVNEEKDLRLQTIIFISSLPNISKQGKVLFVLKNIFGLSIAELSSNILSNQEAIYKSLNRTKKNIQLRCAHKNVDVYAVHADEKTISIVEEVLYGVFNTGFDSFNEKDKNIINEDLCLEAFALTKLLYKEYNANTTSHLFALFCFHIARIPAKVVHGKLISFFNQDREKWNKEMINSGFYHLKKSQKLNKYYLETVIISKYMTVDRFTSKDWNDVAKLYKIMLKISQSPIIKLNYCFCLSKIGKTESALIVLSEIEKELPVEHLYFSLVKAQISKEINVKESHDLMTTINQKVNQRIRKDFILENGLIPI